MELFQQSVRHVKKKDLVQVMVGRDKGKTGRILRVNQKHGRVVVEKVNMVKRHTKATQKGPGGIVDKEAPFSASNVLLYCEKCGKGVRTAMVVEDKKRYRSCKKCKAQLGA